MNTYDPGLEPAERRSPEEWAELTAVRARMDGEAERERQANLARIAAERAAEREHRAKQDARVPDNETLIDALTRARAIQASYEDRFATYVSRDLALKAAVAMMIDPTIDGVILLRQATQVESDDRNLVRGYKQFDAAQMLEAIVAVMAGRA